MEKKIYNVRINKKQVKELKQIPQKFRANILESIKALALNPKPNGYKKLKGQFSEALYRIRCGDYRVVYTINDNDLVILVVKLGHRKDVYSLSE